MRQRYDPSEDRERKRGQIALILVGLLAGLCVVAVLLGTTVNDTRAASLKAVLELVFGPIVGLAGAVTGFYFGEKAGK